MLPKYASQGRMERSDPGGDSSYDTDVLQQRGQQVSLHPVVTAKDSGGGRSCKPLNGSRLRKVNRTDVICTRIDPCQYIRHCRRHRCDDGLEFVCACMNFA